MRLAGEKRREQGRMAGGLTVRKRERRATPSFSDHLSVSGSVLLSDWSKGELLKTQYCTQIWFYNSYTIRSSTFWCQCWGSGTQPELILSEWHLCWRLAPARSSVHGWIQQTHRWKLASCRSACRQKRVFFFPHSFLLAVFSCFQCLC